MLGLTPNVVQKVEPGHIAGGCVFLASSDSDYINGALLNIDGGWMGR
jgi:2-deoxy-D-gluconate 3-dehydrogenase